MRAARPLVAAAALALAPVAAGQALTTTFVGGALSIKGSAGLDAFELTTAMTADGGDEDPPNVFVHPLGDSTVNGSFTDAAFENVLSVKISLGAGADLIQIEQFFGPIVPITVIVGTGDDEVNVIGSTFAAFKVTGGPGADLLTLQQTTTGALKFTDTSEGATLVSVESSFAALTVKGGAGVDQVSLLDVEVAGALAFTLGGGNDEALLTDVTVAEAASFVLGGGDDEFNGNGVTVGGSVQINAGAGDDDVILFDSIVGVAMDVKLGSGPNIIALGALSAPMLVSDSISIKGGPDVDQVALIEETDDFDFAIGADVVLLLKSGENLLEQENDVVIGRDLLITAGSLADALEFTGLTVTRDASISLANGENTLGLTDCSIGNDLTITTGVDDDTVQLSRVAVGGTQSISLGGGET